MTSSSREDQHKADVETKRLQGDLAVKWRRWGPYVSERAWGTVREDYSANGDAWAYFPHDLARSKAYRWGEDGLAAICDRYQVLVFALGLWNEKDSILKERAYGLVPTEGNHGEDVKEYYFYLDSTPSHSYMRWLYKYPQQAYPYEKLVRENQNRMGRGEEYELLDTGIFDEDRYFDVTVEYAKEGPEDMAIRITVDNRGPESAPLHILPHLWFRNTWSWGEEPLPQPEIVCGDAGPEFVSLRADDKNAPPITSLKTDYRLGQRWLIGEADGAPLFCDNETNAARVHGTGVKASSAYPKDGIGRYVVKGESRGVNPGGVGTKSCLHYVRDVPAGGQCVIRLRLSPTPPQPTSLREVDGVIAARRAEADDYYAALHPPEASEEECYVQRQALAGMLWSKQLYLFDVETWLDGDNPAWPPPKERHTIRNQHWRHVNSMRIMLMPDKWEYPWFAAWDLAFHAVTLALVDSQMAKQQMWMLLFEQFLHPSGQIPAYEWEYSDLNPPVHPWAVWRVYNMDKRRTGVADRAFLEKCFHKLLLNFSFWVNKVDRDGNNVFEGGFLGLDNITVLDRSERPPGGAVLEQSDGTGWMGMFCLQMMRMALELSDENSVYEYLANKFFQHYVYVAAAMKRRGGRDYSLWDEEDGFFYDVLRFPDGHFERFRVRSLVGLVPLYAVERLVEDNMKRFPEFMRGFRWFTTNRPRRVAEVVHKMGGEGDPSTHALSILNEEQLRGVLRRLLDPEEFMSPFGPRSLSRAHLEKPFRFGMETVAYEAAESDSKLKGGNSNWRGPIWFPTSFLLIESLRKLGAAFGDEFTVPAEGTQGEPRDLWRVAESMADGLIRIFLRDENGNRPVHGRRKKFQEDPHWRDLILFYEYFNGDTGEGVGASHQSGWTSLVANLIDEWRRPRAG